MYPFIWIATQKSYPSIDAGIFLHMGLAGLLFSLRWFIATLRNPGAFRDEAKSGL